MSLRAVGLWIVCAGEERFVFVSFKWFDELERKKKKTEREFQLCRTCRLMNITISIPGVERLVTVNRSAAQRWADCVQVGLYMYGWGGVRIVLYSRWYDVKMALGWTHELTRQKIPTHNYCMWRSHIWIHIHGVCFKPPESTDWWATQLQTNSRGRTNRRW